MATVEVAWRGLDDESRLDVASVDFNDDGGFVATGRQTTDTYRAQWDLVADEMWRTRLLTVDVEGIGAREWQRHLNLWRRDGRAGGSGGVGSGGVGSGSSVWRSEVGESGDVPREFGEAGIVEENLALLADAVDVDLSGCPLTNTMPIRRLGVMAEGIAERPLTMAWVSLPDLAVMPASQVYSSGASGLNDIASALDDQVAAVVRYRSTTRNVSVDLSVDRHGLVVTYPDLAARLALD